MWKHYFRIGFRQLKKNGWYTLVHLLGLSIAFAVAIVLFLAVDFEFSYDRFHKKKDRLYQVYYETYPKEGKRQDASFPIPFAPTAADELGGIEALCRYADVGGVWIKSGDKRLDVTTRFVDPTFLDMFSFSLLSGDIETALQEPNSLVITRQMALNLFGDTAVLGKTVELQTGGLQQHFMIRGVLEDIPEASSIRFEALAPFKQFAASQPDAESWNAFNHAVFLELKPGVNPLDFQEQSRSFVGQHFHDMLENLAGEGAHKNAFGDYAQLKLLPLNEMHYTDLSIGRAQVQQMYPYVLLGISCLLLLIACSNFINLSLAASFQRHTEIGMRKTLGGLRRQLMQQFWMEAFLVCAFAFILGVLLAGVGLPKFNALMGYDLSLGSLFTLRHILFLIFLLAGVSLVAGGYPAWKLGRLNALGALSGELKFGSKPRTAQVLAIVQFSFSMLMIMTALVASRQIHYLINKPLGYNQSSVISIPISGIIESEQAMAQMRHALSRLPYVESVTGTGVNMGMGNDGSRSRWRIGFDYQEKVVRTDWIRVDYDYLKTLEIPLVEGRTFSPDFPSDTAGVIINQAMAHALGGEDLIGTQLPVMEEKSYQIIGVMKDFHSQTLHESVLPLTISIDKTQAPLEYIFVRVRPDKWKQAFEQVQQQWADLVPQVVAEPTFLEENVQRMYRQEMRFSKILSSGSLIAIVIACLGLFSLTALLLQEKVKEIGIRKVLGAGRGALLILLSGRYLKLVLIAFIISAPIAWLLIGRWLDHFAYRIGTVFLWVVLSGGLVLIVAMATVLSLAFKAARAKPVQALRSE